MPGHPLAGRFTAIRAHLGRRHHADFAELQREIDQLETEMQALTPAAGCPCHCQQPPTTPATITLTLSTRENSPMSELTFPYGAPVYANAAITNAEGQTIPDGGGTWTTTAGTINPNPSNPDTATIVGLPTGDFTVTYTASNGATSSASGTVVDSAPVTVAVSLSATAPADDTPASA